MYKHSPQKEPKHGIRASLGSLCGVALCFFLSTVLRPVWAWQLAAVVFIFIFIEICSKYLLCEYSYLFDKGFLIVLKKQGQREKKIGEIEIGIGGILLSENEYKLRRGEWKIMQRYSYCQNFASKNSFVYIFTQNMQTCMLRFEPDETLRQLICEAVNQAEK